MLVVTTPERPNSRMMARPMTKGGVMIGSSVSARSALAEAEAGARHHQREDKAEQRC